MAIDDQRLSQQLDHEIQQTQAFYQDKIDKLQMQGEPIKQIAHQFFCCLQQLNRERTPLHMLQVVQAAKACEQLGYTPVIVRKYSAVQCQKKEAA